MNILLITACAPLPPAPTGTVIHSHIKHKTWRTHGVLLARDSTCTATTNSTPPCRHAPATAHVASQPHHATTIAAAACNRHYSGCSHTVLRALLLLPCRRCETRGICSTGGAAAAAAAAADDAADDAADNDADRQASGWEYAAHFAGLFERSKLKGEGGRRCVSG